LRQVVNVIAAPLMTTMVTPLRSDQAPMGAGSATMFVPSPLTSQHDGL